MVADIRSLKQLPGARGWDVHESDLDGIGRAEVWFIREGGIPDEWSLVGIRDEVDRASGLDDEERIKSNT
jgi:hypothetical protein